MGVTFINPFVFSGFDPLSLSPALWLDASDAATITSSGGKVSQWNDKSGNGRNVTQATSAAQPSTGTATQNGRNVLVFDGSDYLAAATAADWKFLHDGTNYIVASAVQFGTSANPDALYVLLSTFNSAFTFVGTWMGFDDRPTAGRSLQLRQSLANGSGTASVLNNSADNTATAGSFTVFSLLADPDNATAADRSALFQNAAGAIKNNANTAAVSSANPEFPLHVGIIFDSRPSPAILGYLVGRVAELVIVSGVNATEANRVALRDYLNTKWAVY